MFGTTCFIVSPSDLQRDDCRTLLAFSRFFSLFLAFHRTTCTSN